MNHNKNSIIMVNYVLNFAGKVTKQYYGSFSAHMHIHKKNITIKIHKNLNKNKVMVI